MAKVYSINDYKKQADGYYIYSFPWGVAFWDISAECWLHVTLMPSNQTINLRGMDVDISYFGITFHVEDEQ